MWFPTIIGACDNHIGRHVQIGNWHRPFSSDRAACPANNAMADQFLQRLCYASPWAFSRYRSDSAKNEVAMRKAHLLAAVTNLETLCPSRKFSSGMRMLKQNRKFDFKSYFYFITAAGRQKDRGMDVWEEEGIITGRVQALALRNFGLFCWEGKWCGKENKEERGGWIESVLLVLS